MRKRTESGARELSRGEARVEPGKAKLIPGWTRTNDQRINSPVPERALKFNAPTIGNVRLTPSVGSAAVQFTADQIRYDAHSGEVLSGGVVAVPARDLRVKGDRMMPVPNGGLNWTGNVAVDVGAGNLELQSSNLEITLSDGLAVIRTDLAQLGGSAPSGVVPYPDKKVAF